MSISPHSLLSADRYAAYRREHRGKLIAYRRSRSVMLGEHALLQFEDVHTVRYQIQEMLRVERIGDAAGIQEQIDTYSALIPDGGNWKATLMLQIPDAGLRSVLLPRINLIGPRVFIKVEGHAPIHAIANEDLDPRDRRPSAVHFLRFNLLAPIRIAILNGVPVSVGCDHPDYPARTMLPVATRDRLVSDLCGHSPFPGEGAGPVLFPWLT